jgi:hypothetical protein
MKSFSVLAVVALLGAAGSPASVTVAPSSIGFKQALEACPAGTLGAITLTLGHVRVAEAAGVQSDIDDANPSAQTISLSGSAGSASVKVDAAKNAVSAKHVTLESGKRVACIAPD